MLCPYNALPRPVTDSNIYLKILKNGVFAQRKECMLLICLLGCARAGMSV